MARKSADSDGGETTSTLNFVEAWLRRNKETVSLVSLFLAVLGFALSLALAVHGIKADADKRAADDAAAAQTKEDSIVKRVQATVAAGQGKMNALQILASSSTSIGGWAWVDDKSVPGLPPEKHKKLNRTPSSIAVAQDPSYESIDHFDLNLSAINAIVGLAKALRGTAIEGKKATNVQFFREYLAPMLYPRIQSDDPAVAASALLACAQLLSEDAERREILNQDGETGTRSLQEALRQARFTKVNFSGHAPHFRLYEFNEANLDRAVLKECNLSGTKLKGASALGTQFIDSVLDEMQASSGKKPGTGGFIRPEKAEMDRHRKMSTKLDNATFESRSDTNGLKCSNAEFQYCSLVETTFLQTTINDSCFFAADLSKMKAKVATFKGCDFRMAVFDDSTEIAGCRFNLCQLQGASFRRVSFRTTPTEFNGGQAGHAVFDFGSAQDGSAVTFASGIDLTCADLSKCNLGKCQFAGAKVNWAQFPVLTGPEHASHPNHMESIRKRFAGPTGQLNQKSDLIQLEGPPNDKANVAGVVVLLVQSEAGADHRNKVVGFMTGGTQFEINSSVDLQGVITRLTATEERIIKDELNLDFDTIRGGRPDDIAKHLAERWNITFM